MAKSLNDEEDRQKIIEAANGLSEISAPKWLIFLIKYMPIVGFVAIFLEILKDKIFFKYDIFISYARKDGYMFAHMLSNELAKKKFMCFIDQWDNSPSRQLSYRIRSRAASCKMIVILATPNSLNSDFIKEEIEIFSKSGRSIIPISFGRIEEAKWFPLIEGLPYVTLQKEEYLSPKVDSHLTERIDNSFRYTKRLKKLSKVFWFCFILIVANFIYLGYKHYELNNLSESYKNLELENKYERSRANRNVFSSYAEFDSLKTKIWILQNEKRHLENEIIYLKGTLKLKEITLKEYKKQNSKTAEVQTRK